MSKQEEIREGIAKQLYTDWNRYPFKDGRNNNELMHWSDLPEYSKDAYREWVDVYVFQTLHSQGAVRKVERELPENPYHDRDGSSKSQYITYAYGQGDMLKAGYVAVKPLIEEVNDVTY